MDLHPINDVKDWKFPLFLSCMAGASTCIGAAIVFCFSSEAIADSMSFSLSLAASVMITVSLISIGPECMEGVFQYEGSRLVHFDSGAFLERFFSFVSGCLAYYLLSKVLVSLPEPESIFSTSPTNATSKQKVENDPWDVEDRQHLLYRTGSASSPSSSSSSVSDLSTNRNSNQKSGPTVRKNAQIVAKVSFMATTRSEVDDNGNAKDMTLDNRAIPTGDEEARRKRSWRVTMLLFVSLLLHNFPEGLAVVASTVESKDLGLTVAIGIAAHNIPEGIAIAVPCIAARPEAPWLAFWLASISGLAEPLGACVALGLLQGTKLQLENILAGVAGVMCMVSVVELYPEACRHIRNEDFRGIISGTIVGMLIMVATELYMP